MYVRMYSTVQTGLTLNFPYLGSFLSKHPPRPSHPEPTEAASPLRSGAGAGRPRGGRGAGAWPRRVRFDGESNVGGRARAQKKKKKKHLCGAACARPHWVDGDGAVGVWPGGEVVKAGGHTPRAPARGGVGS